MAFNSKQYSWSNVQVVVLGRVLTGIRGVKYKTSREKEVLHGAGSSPYSIQSGKKTYEGEITLMQSEYETLYAAATAAGFEDVTDLTFDVTVAYKPETGQSGAIVRKIVQQCEITEVEEGMSEGDKFMEITIPFLALGVKTSV